MVTTKFIIEVILVVIALVIVLWWIYTNYDTIVTAFQRWVSDMLM